MNKPILKELYWNSTHVLVLFSLITIGIYPVFYVRRQSEILNRYFKENQFSTIFILSYLVIFSLRAVFDFFHLFSLDNEQLEILSDYLYLCACVASMYWSFKVRNKLNNAYGFIRGQNNYFKLRYTLIFVFFYINYKINQINRKAEQAVLSDA